MSTAPRYPADLGYAGLQMTADEFFALGETPDRYELINGIVVMSPSATLRHQLVLRYLLREMEATPTGRAALIAPDTDLRLTRGKVYRPDLLVYAAGRVPASTERLSSPPDLAVEILSPATKPLDLITKRDDYDAFGAGEYWVIDPATLTARVWRRDGAAGKMLEAGVEGDAIDCASLPGLRVDLAAIRLALNEGSR